MKKLLLLGLTLGSSLSMAYTFRAAGISDATCEYTLTADVNQNAQAIATPNVAAVVVNPTLNWKLVEKFSGDVLLKGTNEQIVLGTCYGHSIALMTTAAVEIGDKAELDLKKDSLAKDDFNKKAKNLFWVVTKHKLVHVSEYKAGKSLFVNLIPGPKGPVFAHAEASNGYRAVVDFDGNVLEYSAAQEK